jgi:hypothetical protein
VVFTPAVGQSLGFAGASCTSGIRPTFGFAFHFISLFFLFLSSKIFFILVNSSSHIVKNMSELF